MPKKPETENPDCQAELRYVETLLGHAILKLAELRTTGLPQARKDGPPCIEEVLRLVRHAEVFATGSCHKVVEALRAMADPEFVRSSSKARIRELEDQLGRFLEEYNAVSS